MIHHLKRLDVKDLDFAWVFCLRIWGKAYLITFNTIAKESDLMIKQSFFGKALVIALQMIKWFIGLQTASSITVLTTVNVIRKKKNVNRTPGSLEHFTKLESTGLQSRKFTLRNIIKYPGLKRSQANGNSNNSDLGCYVFLIPNNDINFLVDFCF